MSLATASSSKMPDGVKGLMKKEAALEKATKCIGV